MLQPIRFFKQWGKNLNMNDDVLAELFPHYQEIFSSKPISQISQSGKLIMCGFHYVCRSKEDYLQKCYGLSKIGDKVFSSSESTLPIAAFVLVSSLVKIIVLQCPPANTRNTNIQIILYHQSDSVVDPLQAISTLEQSKPLLEEAIKGLISVDSTLELVSRPTVVDSYLLLNQQDVGIRIYAQDFSIILAWLRSHGHENPVPREYFASAQHTGQYRYT